MISYLLTSKETEERLQITLNHLKEFGYNPIVFYGPKIPSYSIDIKREIPVHWHPGAKIESCALGHVSILKEFLETDNKICLVFEDDCLLSEKITTEIFENLEFDIFLIGGIISGLTLEEKNYKVSDNFLLTHCYVISKSGAKKILKEVEGIEEIGHIDQFMSKVFDKIHSINPLISNQNSVWKSGLRN